MNVVKMGVVPLKKRKAKTTESNPKAQLSISKAHDSSVNVMDGTQYEPLESTNIFRRKKLKLTPSHSHI